jgi:hypothetical protein
MVSVSLLSLIMPFWLFKLSQTEPAKSGALESAFFTSLKSASKRAKALRAKTLAILGTRWTTSHEGDFLVL